MKLERGFEEAAKQALLDDVEHKLAGEYDNLVFQAISVAHGRLDRYGRELDYNVEPIKESLVVEDVQRDEDSVTVRFGWTHEASVYLEFGTSDHEIQGEPILSFVWEDDVPDWVAEEFDEEGDGYRVFLPEVEVAGIAEVRFARKALRWLRSELED